MHCIRFLLLLTVFSQLGVISNTEAKELSNTMCAPPKPDQDVIENQKWVLKARPNGAFNPDTDVELVTEMLALSLTADSEEKSDNPAKFCPDDQVIVYQWPEDLHRPFF